jgi:hypothetical protein
LGGPVFSSAIASDASVVPASIVNGVPWNALFPNGEGCSSFIAIKNLGVKIRGVDQTQIWINASEGAFNDVSNMEYQVRLYSGDPGAQDSTAFVQIGASYNQGNFLKATQLSSGSFTLSLQFAPP